MLIFDREDLAEWTWEVAVKWDLKEWKMMEITPSLLSVYHKHTLAFLSGEKANVCL